jgi:beta-fructofuranosidase
MIDKQPSLNGSVEPLNKQMSGERVWTHQQLIDKAEKAIAEHSGLAARDVHRLHYHFMPRANWMNDPNGLIWYKGEYHLFYQHYPYSPTWGPMHWGHAKSKDLVHWEHLPVALAPSEWYDMGMSNVHGCWSGSAVDDDGTLTLIYTGHVNDNDPKETQCVARSTDGIHFVKHADNPVIKEAPENDCFGFRDPKVWKHEGKWYMVVGAGKDGIGKLYLYRSDDLLRWQYVGVAAESDGTMGDMWECPDLFPLSGKHVLIISPMNIRDKNMVLVGEMDYLSGRFLPERRSKLDYGFDFYAAQTFMDGKGRRILMAWMANWGSRMISGAHERGWFGAMTLPRELTVGDGGKVLIRPVRELELLRKEYRVFGEVLLRPGEHEVLKDFRGVSYELIAEIDFSDNVESFGFLLRCSDDGTEKTAVTYRVREKTLVVDRNCSGKIGDGGICAAALEGSGSTIKLHIFVDTSSLEVFANDGEIAITNRIYPSPGSDKVQLFSIGGLVKFRRLEAWTLKNAGNP